jgi:hypothetical protein
MTLQTAECSKTFIGAETTGPFTWTWRFFANGHITAVKTVAGVEVPLSEGTDYTLTGANGYQGGTLTLVAALLTGETLYVERNTPAIQSIDLRNQGDFFPETYEDALDYGMAIKQEQNRDANLHLRLTPPGTGVSVTMPLPSSGMGVRWNTEGDALEAVGLNAETWDAEPGTRAAVDADLQTQIDSNDVELADHEDRVSRSLKFPVGDTTSPTIPDATTRANKALGFDLAGVPVAFDVAADLSGYAISKTPVADALPQYDPDGVIQGTNIVHRVDTIADLRLLTGSPGRSAVQVLGYYAAGDGGGGPVRHWVDGAAPGTYVDDGGATLVPTGGDGSAAWLFTEDSGDYNVATFGAKAGTDSTASVQACADYLVAKGGGGLFFPKSYILGPITITMGVNRRGLWIHGVGMRSTLTPSGPIDIFTIDMGTSNFQSLLVEKLQFDFNLQDARAIVTIAGGMAGHYADLYVKGFSATATKPAIITGVNDHVVKFDRINMIGNLQKGIGINSQGYSSNFSNVNLTFLDTAIVMGEISNANIKESRIDENNVGISVSGISLFQLNIQGNRFERNKNYSIYLQGYGSDPDLIKGVTVQDNYFTGLNEPTNVGIYIKNTISTSILRNVFKSTDNINILGVPLIVDTNNTRVAINGNTTVYLSGDFSDITNIFEVDNIKQDQNTASGILGRVRVIPDLSTNYPITLNARMYLAAFSAPTNFTGFTGGVSGFDLYLKSSNTNLTLVHNLSALILKGGVSRALTAGETVHLIMINAGIWNEI